MWKNLTISGKMFFGLITFLIVSSYFTVPAGKLAWYLISNDDKIALQNFVPCDYDIPSITWDEDDVMQVNKELHFCGSPEQGVPAKTAIVLPDGTIIMPMEETKSTSTFNVDIIQLPTKGWHIIKL